MRERGVERRHAACPQGAVQSRAVGLTFVWDGRKAEANQRKHGVSFGDAVTVFRDPLSLTVSDPDTEPDDERWVTVGCTIRGQLLVVIHADRADTIRVISARQATRNERRNYEEA